MRRWVLLLCAVAGHVASAEDAGLAVRAKSKTPGSAVHQAPVSESPDQVAWRFFDLCTRGGEKEAWELTAPVLKERITPERLKQVVELAGMKNLPPISWKIEGGGDALVWVRGDYLPNRRDPVRLSVVLLWEENGWRVYSACSLAADMKQTDEVLFSPVESGEATALPPLLSTRDAASRDLRAILVLLKKRQMSDAFRNEYVQSGRPQRVSRVSLNTETVYRLMDRKLFIDLGAPIKIESPLKLGREGVAEVKGSIEVGTDLLDLSVQYGLTKQGWKPGVVACRLVPGLAECERLANETFARFDDALKRHSFDKFYDSISEAWKKQRISAEQLEKAFQSFQNQQADIISSRLDVPLRLHGRPTETPDGLFLVAGHYETRPTEVHFSLKFLYEAPVWKLFGIDVNFKKPEAETAADGSGVQ